MKQWKVGDCREIFKTIEASDVEHFAELTGDHNPLHMDEAYANKALAGGRVVHGMLAASYVSTLIGMELPGPGSLWNRFEITWKKMIRIGDRLKISGEVVSTSESTSTLELKIEAKLDSSSELIFSAKANAQILAESTIKSTKKETIQEHAQKSSQTKKLSAWTLITGGSGGLGQVICKKLIEDGHRLIVLGQNQDKLNNLKETFQTKDLICHSINLSDQIALANLIQSILKETQIQHVIHAAAAPYQGISIEEEENLINIQNHFMVDFLSFATICSYTLKQMENGASLVAISTQYALDTPPPLSSAYVSAKLAMSGYVKSIACEAGPKGIRANLISPGIINTPYSADITPRKKMVEAASNPLRRLCIPEDVANAISYLCSDKASFINGVNLPITGGARMPL